MPGINYSAHQFNPIAQGHGAAIAAAKADSQSIGFGDLLDVVNPLQHLPVVSVLYRHLTGDTISPAAKVVGDTAYGGPMGLLSSLGDMLFQKLTGKGVGDTVYAMVTGDDTSTVEGATGYAEAEKPEAESTKLAANTATGAPAILSPTLALADSTAPLAAPTIPVEVQAAEVKPALAEPSLLALPAAIGERVGEVARQTSETAAKAYRAAGHLLAAY